MNISSEFLGWSKDVVSERDDGEHVTLQAMYFCRTLVEAVTLQGYRQPTHVKLHDEVLTRTAPSIYGSDVGRMYVVFDWRARDEFIPILE